MSQHLQVSNISPFVIRAGESNLARRRRNSIMDYFSEPHTFYL